MRCLVTGAAGFVGSSICDRLLRDGHDVCGIDNFLDYYPRQFKERNLTGARSNPKFKFIEQDIAQADLNTLLDGVDWVFHQAAQAGVRASWGDYFTTYVNCNVIATQKILETIRLRGGVKKIVYASSSSVYGNAEQFPTSEELAPAPVSPYGVTKLAGEHLMSLYAKEYGLPTASLRYFTVYGPRQRPDMAFHKFIRAGLLGEEISLYGDGEQSRDFTYIDDAVEANILAAQFNGSGGEVFNVGGGAVTTVNEVLATLNELLGPLKINRTERQAGDARHTCADTSRARELLGYSPKVPLKVGLQREIEWLREIVAR